MSYTETFSTIPLVKFCLIFSHSSYEKLLILCEFSSNLYVLRPSESEKTVFTKVSICPASVDTINLDGIIGLD